MGVGGGFATPFLFASGVDAQVTLFSYDALLGVGTLYLARRRDWPVLNLVSFGFTWFTVAMWADRFYSSGEVAPHRVLPDAVLRPLPRHPRRAAEASRLAQPRFARAGAGPGDLPPVVAGDPVGPWRRAARLPDRRDAGRRGGLRASRVRALAARRVGRGHPAAAGLDFAATARRGGSMASLVAAAAIFALHLLAAARRDLPPRSHALAARRRAAAPERLRADGRRLSGARERGAGLGADGHPGHRRGAWRAWRGGSAVRIGAPRLHALAVALGAVTIAVRCDSTGRRSPWRSPSKARSSSRSA